MNEVAAPKHAHPKYCFKIATGTGKTWVLQALMIWQMLNKTAALAEGIDDARFTRYFLVVAPGLIVYGRLLDAFRGKLVESGNGSRDFASSDIARFADLLIPDVYRDAVFAFVRGNVCNKTEIGLKATGNGMIAFNPMDGKDWRVLLLQSVVDHITKVFAVPLLESEQKHVTGQTEVHLRRLSEVPALMVRESHSVTVSKCIYTRLGWPARNGGLERTLIHWAQADTQVEAFCKISENRHTFARLRYVKEDALPAFYSPDFLVRTADAVYLVGTKAQQQTIHPNVQRKCKAALAWCERINGLSTEQRGGAPWHCVLLAENVVVEWQAKGARLAELLDYARLRPLASATLQQQLI